MQGIPRGKETLQNGSLCQFFSDVQWEGVWRRGTHARDSVGGCCVWQRPWAHCWILWISHLIWPATGNVGQSPHTLFFTVTRNSIVKQKSKGWSLRSPWIKGKVLYSLPRKTSVGHHSQELSSAIWSLDWAVASGWLGFLCTPMLGMLATSWGQETLVLIRILAWADSGPPYGCGEAVHEAPF